MPNAFVHYLLVCAFEVVRCSFIQCSVGIVIQNEMHCTNAPNSCTTWFGTFFSLFLSLSHTHNTHTLTHSAQRLPESIFTFIFFPFYLFLVFILSRLLAAIIIHLVFGSHSHRTLTLTRHSLCLCPSTRSRTHIRMKERKRWHCCGAICTRIRCRTRT